MPKDEMVRQTHYMNPFVNPRKRGVQLPKGCKELAGVLQHTKRAKCGYCGEPAVATPGWPGDYRWCDLCNQDLRDFAKIEVKVHYKKFGPVEPFSEAELSRYRDGVQRRQDEFMRDRLKQRELQ
jgi:hypothetical protein